MDIQEFTDRVIRHGHEGRMQDLKLFPEKEGYGVLFRKGSQREVFAHIEEAEGQQMISRLKFLGGMDVGEKRKSQLGAITYICEGLEQRLRLSSVGTHQLRESLVVRFLHDMESEELHFFIAEQLATVTRATRKPQLYLFSGPTGSGKTTLMYHLAKADGGEVITIEDPVEIVEERFLQLQVNEKIGQDYDQLIQLSLRHRPDVLIVGEIRDRKTAKAAIRAALTGHKVFATIHARGVSETEARIRDLVGVDQELVNCLGGIIYQRLLLDSAGQLRALLAYDFPAQRLAHEEWQGNVMEVKEELADYENDL